MTDFSGYEEAEYIDKQIGSLIDKYPITEKNHAAWMNFARSIQTSCILIAMVAYQKAKLSIKGDRND